MVWDDMEPGIVSADCRKTLETRGRNPERSWCSILLRQIPLMKEL